MEPVVMPLESLPAGDIPMGMMGAIFSAMAGTMIVLMILMVFMIIVNWKLFEKAGFKGYESLIPGHNFVVMIQIAGKPISYFFLMLIPFANIYYMVKIIHGISKSFGKGSGFTWGLILLPIIFLPLLVWGDAEYAPGGSVEEIQQEQVASEEIETIEEVVEMPQTEEALSTEVPSAEPVSEEVVEQSPAVETPTTSVVPPAVVLPTQEPPLPPSV